MSRTNVAGTTAPSGSGGARHRRKGDRIERELVERHRALGVHAERYPLSGASHAKTAAMRYQNYFRIGRRGQMAKKTDRAAQRRRLDGGGKQGGRRAAEVWARLRRARAARDEPEVIGRFEGFTPDTPEPADMSDDDVQEYRDDGPAPEDEPDILPD